MWGAQQSQGKDPKAKWYQRRKAARSSATNVTSDESDFTLSSPGSSRTTASEIPIASSACIETDSEPDPKQDAGTVFRYGLPVNK